ncbi:hypothetical protein AB0F77_08940 [Streptomyces sp. NPDC026672]|uniref:hypothetical protein n=1 Tax=unclassified Streptomyces TaxID=2593676 RepID=UPI0033CB2782
MSGTPSSGQPGDRPDDGSSIPDEEWERFLHQAVAEDKRRGRSRSSAPREESARERAARRSRQAAQQPPGWRTGPAWREIDGRGRRRRAVRNGIGVALALLVAVVAVRPSLLTDRLPGREADAAASPSPLPAETAPPSTGPGAADSAGGPTRAHPFRGSPAEAWGEGADAIELPAAKATGGLGKDEVAQALRRAKEFLVAGSLDPAVLGGARPADALALLDPKQPDVLKDVEGALRAPTERHDPVSLFSRFDPKEARIAGDVVKVRGHMTFAAGKPGQVEVHADYTFVYPLVRAHGDGDVVARTIVRRDVKMIASDPNRWIVTRGRLLLGSWDAEYYNDACDVYDGYLHPMFPDDGPTSSPGTGPAEDPYDRSRPLPDASPAADDGQCGTVTRT